MADKSAARRVRLDDADDTLLRDVGIIRGKPRPLFARRLSRGRDERRPAFLPVGDEHHALAILLHTQKGVVFGSLARRGPGPAEPVAVGAARRIDGRDRSLEFRAGGRRAEDDLRNHPPEQSAGPDPAEIVPAEDDGLGVDVAERAVLKPLEGVEAERVRLERPAFTAGLGRGVEGIRAYRPYIAEVEVILAYERKVRMLERPFAICRHFREADLERGRRCAFAVECAVQHVRRIRKV